MPDSEVRQNVSVMIFTLDEEINLPHCLGSLAWCQDVIVVDSGSADRTVEIASNWGARVFSHAFEGFGKQRNWAIDHTSPRNPWVLILDADERVPVKLADELVALVNSDPDIAAARVRRRFYMWGKWLKHSSLYPTWVVRLVHIDRVRYINRGHAETQEVEGKVVALTNDLLDENHKGLEDWYARQERYALADARYEVDHESGGINWKDLLSADPLVKKMAMKRLSWRMPCRGLIYFLYSYAFRGGFRDGRYGFRFCRMRAAYQSMVVQNKKKVKQNTIIE